MSLLGPQLDAFLSVVRHQTVQHAAKELRLTQTGVTQRIRSLERQLGTTLFTRSRRGMRPTVEGEALLHYCQAAQDLSGEALAKMQRSGVDREVRVCITGPTSAIHTRVIPQCNIVRAKYPMLLFQFDFADDFSAANKLRTGFAHLAILPSDQVALEMDSKTLKPTRYVLIGPKSWRGRSLKEIIKKERIVDFDPDDEMTLRYLKQFRLFKYAKNDRHFAGNTDALAEMIAFGYGFSVLPDSFAKPLIDTKKVIDLNPGYVLNYPLALAWYPRPEMPAYFRDLVQAIR